MEVEMKIRGLMMDPVTNMAHRHPEGRERQRHSAIGSAVYEANAIALEIERVSTPRR